MNPKNSKLTNTNYSFSSRFAPVPNMTELESHKTDTDFEAMWKSVRSQTTCGIPVRRLFFCDCGFQSKTHASLFVHTSSCALPTVIARWGKSCVVMPSRELRALEYEYKAYLKDEPLAEQIWMIAYKLVKLPVCFTELLKPKFAEVAGWYGLDAAQTERLWKTTQLKKSF